MEKLASRNGTVMSYRSISQDQDAELFDQLLTAFATACGLKKAVLAEGLLSCIEEWLGLDEPAAEANLGRLERLVDARYRLLEVKYASRRGGG